MAGETQNQSARTLEELLEAGAEWLGRRGVSDARLQCEWLAAALFGCRRTALPLGDAPKPDIVDALRAGLRRLGGGEPVQYVIGEWDFRMLTLRTDRRALIPRPETEGLVSLVLEEPRLWQGTAPSCRRSSLSCASPEPGMPRLWQGDAPSCRRGSSSCASPGPGEQSPILPGPLLYDVGTGTGAIALSLAYERPECRVVAVDCEKEALSLARENCARLALEDRVSFVLGKNCAGAAPGSLDAVVSNPPYISSAEVDVLPATIRAFEPRTALDGGADGLDVFRGLVHDAAIALRRGGFAFFEIGDGQGDAVRALMEDAGFSEVVVLKDLAGLVRYVKGRME